MIILHDALKTVQNLGFFFLSKKNKEKLSSLEENQSFHQPILWVTHYNANCGFWIGEDTST